MAPIESKEGHKDVEKGSSLDLFNLDLSLGRTEFHFFIY